MQIACFFIRAANIDITLNRSIFESNSQRCLFKMTCVIHRIIYHFLVHIIKSLFLVCHFHCLCLRYFPFSFPYISITFCLCSEFPFHFSNFIHLANVFHPKEWVLLLVPFHEPYSWSTVAFYLLRNCQGDSWEVQTRVREATIQQMKRKKRSTGWRSKWGSRPDLGM